MPVELFEINPHKQKSFLLVQIISQIAMELYTLDCGLLGRTFGSLQDKWVVRNVAFFQQVFRKCL